MGHRAAGRNAVELVGQRAGRALAAADVSGARAIDRRVDALRPAGAEFQNGAALRGPHDAVGLRRDEALVVERQQQKRLDELIGSRGKIGVPSGTAQISPVKRKPRRYCRKPSSNIFRLRRYAISSSSK